MKNRKINIYQIVLIAALIGLIVFTAFNMASHRLFVKSGKEFADSVVYYFKNLFFIEAEVPKESVTFLVYDETIIKSLLPVDIEVFGYRFLSTFEIMVNKHFFIPSWNGFGLSMSKFINVIMLFGLPVIVIAVIYHMIIFRDVPNSESNEQSKPLRIYLKIKEKTIDPVKYFLVNLWYTFRYTKWLFWPAVILALYNINIISLVLIVCAWYLYFVFSVDFLSLWTLLCKFVICISPLLKPFFWPFWIILFIVIIIKLKIRRAYAKLDEMYFKNEQFINDNFGVVTGIYGPPGTGKTTSAVAFATQIEVMLREKAKSQIMEIRAEFPDFPFRYIEEDVEYLKNSGKAVNKVQIQTYFKQQLEDVEIIYGYNLYSQKNCHYDGLSVAYLKDEIIDYAQLYFIYISILAYSTYSIRYDKGIELTHAFPGMRYNFFHRDLRMDEYKETNQSYHANIFNYNLLRLNNQLENVYNKSIDQLTEDERKELDKIITLFDFGVITISEIAKERGNKDSNKNRDFRSDTKPTNDGLANCLGLIRHLTTVRHQQYGFIIWDDQKISALRQIEAAMAEVNIFIPKQTKNKKNTMPLWFIEGVFLEWGLSYFYGLYDKYIGYRNDQTLFSHIVFHLYSFFFNINRKISNTFGFKRYELSMSGVNVNGSQEQRGDSVFYVMDKIVYAGNKFDTAVYSGFFSKLKLQADIGNNQSAAFQGKTATFKELQQTRGYMFEELGDAVKEYIKQNEEIRERRKKK